MTDALDTKLSAIRLLSLDCDGVMTDGALYYAADGTELRKFHVRDGVGIKSVMASGIAVAFITASKTPAIEHRARALGVPNCFIGVDGKLETLRDLCARLGIALEEVAHVGDDLNDLPVLRKVGFPMTVADAVPEVRQVAMLVTTRNGGDGAVREICERILAARANHPAGEGAQSN